MSRQEIEELLELKGWTQARLAQELELSEAAVSRWLNLKKGPGRSPTGLAAKVMRQMLEQARKEGGKAVAV